MGAGCSRAWRLEGSGEKEGSLQMRWELPCWSECVWSPCGRASRVEGSSPDTGHRWKAGRPQSGPGVCPQLGFDLVRDGSEGKLPVSV